MKIKKTLLAIALCVFSATSLAQTGTASYYGPGFHGKKTANGETYNMYGNSCAHRTLPLGSKITVTNLATGKQVATRVNDRGPFISGRILDMSVGLKNALGCGDLCSVKIA